MLNSKEEMEWSSSVPSAVAQSKNRQSPLLILIEPFHHSTLSKLSTTSLHKFLFPHPVVHRLLSTTNTTTLRIVADPDDTDYKSFKQFFQHAEPPDLILVSSSGAVLWRGDGGYVSPRVFVQGVAAACGVDTHGWFGEPRKSAVLVVPPEKVKATRSPRGEEGDEAPGSRPPKSARTAPSEVSLPKSAMSLPTTKKVKLQARLPGGETVTCSHPAQTLFGVIRTWVSESAALPSSRLLVSTAFPRYVFSAADDAKTLSELRLTPSASLIVADLGGELGREQEAVGLFARGRNAVAGVLGLVTGFVGSFYTTETGPVDGQGDGGGERRGEVPNEDNLRYNGNSTQFGYDDEDR